MRLISFLILVTCLYPPLYSQWDWEWQNPLPQGNNLNKIYFSANNNGWTIGDAGVIMISNDGGYHWDVIENDIDEDLIDLCTIEDEFVWTVGTNGVLLKSIDGGLHWTELTFNNEYHLNTVFFINPTKGWIAGDEGKIYKTEDGGFTWISQQSSIDYPINDIFFLNDSLGWIATGSGWYMYNEGMILKTNNGGQSWLPITNNALAYSRISFCDSLHGWIFSIVDAFQKTEDGGTTWEFVDNLNLLSSLNSVYFVNPEVGFLNNGTMRRTSDGGINWTSQYYHPWGVKDYYFINSKVGWAACIGGSIYKTISAGTSTHRLTETITAYQLNGVHFIDKHKGFAAGWDILLRTIDGGENWIVSDFPNTNFKKFFFLDEFHGWVFGDYGGMMFTEDGGISWESLTAYNALTTVRSFYFTSLLLGYACGNDGEIFRSFDGGNTWEEIDSPTNKDLWDIDFATPEKAWIVGLEGTVLHSSDSGATWIQQEAANLGNFTDVEFIDENTGWASGYSENLMYTRDGGLTWTFQPLPTFGIYHYIGISFADSLHGRLGAYYSEDGSTRFVLYYTSDGGYNWDYTDMRIASWPINSQCFPDPANGWIVGNYGAIIHLFNDSIAVGNEEIIITDNNQLLHVNAYPNPCRGTLNLEYSLKQSEIIKLQIYNSSGILSYQTETHQAKGFQKHPINVSNLTSGLYIYSIESSEGRKTGKFIIAGE